MALFEGITNIINDQFGFGENTDQVANVGPLGNFTNKVDKNIQRSFIEDGFIRNVRPRMREVLWQQPEIHVLIKKRMFSSLVENYKLDLLEENEKLFIKASKILFQNKARLISTYERLTKIEQITHHSGRLNTYFLPPILEGIADLEAAGINIFDAEAKSALTKLRQVYAFSTPSNFTNWALDAQTAFLSDTGEGTGVIELTLVKDFNTFVSNRFGDGNASLALEDPYKLMVITNRDIDMAIADAANRFRTGGFFRFSEQNTEDLIEEDKTQLNRIRQARGASIIQFIINPDTLFSRKVKAIIELEGRELKFEYNPGLVGAGSEIQIDPQELMTNDPNINNLSETEAVLFQRIVKNTFLLIGLKNTTQSEIIQFNEQTNYVRRKMRLHFGNKNLIQPMDVVNIFITTHTESDNYLTAGFEFKNQPTFATRLNNLIRDINNFGQKTAQFSGIQISMNELERSAIMGPDFPLWMWNMFRGDFIRQDAGPAVFVGLVKEASRSESNGVHSLNIRCEDNAGYFNKSEINLKPALDVFNGNLYDPLTPFDVSFDASTGSAYTENEENIMPKLLDDNNAILNSKLVKFKAGRWRGTRVRDFIFRANDRELSFNGVRRVIHAPDGFVYRWKEGIESLTKTDRAQTESSMGNKERSPLLTSSPFAGQDAMNILSLLVTGQPYNFNTFIKAAIANLNNVSIANDDDNASVSYIDSLVADLNKRNAVWGSFLPFKKLVINEAALSFIESNGREFFNRNQELQSLLRKRARLIDTLMIRSSKDFFASATAFPRDERGQLSLIEGDNFDTQDVALADQINKLDSRIRKIKDDIAKSIRNINAQNNGNIRIAGDDLSLDPTLSDGGNSLTDAEIQQERMEFRRKVGFLTLRRFWQVKANQDNNLFIVDDQYDKNTDIQAFERGLDGKLSLFSSEYTSTADQVVKVSTILGLEIFADSQGHIQARPPLYNRMPSSVFYKMFKQRAYQGIQVFPEFLESLFTNHVTALLEKIEIAEDQIRLRAIAMNKIQDEDIEKFIKQGQDGTFAFVSDHEGKIGGGDFRGFILQSQYEKSEEYRRKTIEELSKISGDIRRAADASTLIFSPVSRANIALSSTFAAGFTTEAVNRAHQIRERLRLKAAQAPTLDQLMSETDATKLLAQRDQLKLTNEIARFLAERQNLLLTAANAIKNLEEGMKLNIDSRGAAATMFPMLNRQEKIPEIIEHMIEDETNDDLGPGSGGRFIIREVDKISLTITETPPSYTMVEVNGLFGQGFVQAPGNLKLTPQGGNAITSAFAVDYDMWRMYGFKASNAIPAPFFSDPDSQCAPYAVYLLNLARKNILQGNIVLRGNEYYQVGDVVYLEDDDLLFYVDSVSHSISFSGQFTTSLTLKYGHMPGEYIPTHLDIIGKVLYNSRGIASKFRNIRFENANGDVPIGSLTFDGPSVGLFQGSIESLLNGSRGERNKKELSSMLLAASGALRSRRNNKLPKIDIRIYTHSQELGPANPSLQDAAEAVKNWFINPQKTSTDKGINILIPSTEENIGFRVDPKDIRVTVIDAAQNTEQSPSSAAWHAARLMQSSGAGLDMEIFEIFNMTNKLDTIMHNHIIDVWMTYEDFPITMEELDVSLKSQRALQEAESLRRAEARRREQGG